MAKTGAWLSVVASLFWLCAAGVIAWVFGRLLLSQPVSPALAGAVFVALWTLRNLVDVQAQRLLSQAADAQISELRREIVLSESRAAANSTLGGAGALAALTAEKLEALRPALLRYRPARMRVSVVSVVILGIAAWHSWAVALVLLLAGPLIPLFMALVGWAAKDASARQMQEVGQLSDLLMDRLAALSDLRLIGAGPATVDTFAAASDDLRHRTMAVLRIAFLSSTVLELFAALGVAMVAIWVGFSLLGELGWGGWGAPLSPAVGMFLLLLAPEFFQPLRDMASAWHDRAAADAVMQEITTWRDENRPMRVGPGAQAQPISPLPSVETRALCHRGIHYPDIRIAPGDTVAIQGPSGCGKTTLLRLIAGLEKPDGGAVLVGAQALNDHTADPWRGAIGWMPQAPHFLNGSVRFNIGFGDHVSHRTIRQAGLGDVIQTLPRGDLTILGERGAGLSGGEARRVTLARALQAAAGVIIADEPTADLDAETAAIVGDGLIQFAQQGGTLIIATHDQALAARMSRHLNLNLPSLQPGFVTSGSAGDAIV